jgi:hypothetical protein
MRSNLFQLQRPGSARRALLLTLGTILLAGPLSAGSVLFDVANQGGNVYRYDFFPSGLGLLQNQELDIKFDPAFFGSLFNGVAGSDFRLSLLQPNNPVGAFGDYSALALVDNPSVAGPFSVDVTWLSTGTPGELPYIIHQFDPTGQRILGAISSGSLTTPEPACWFLSVVGFAMIGVLRTGRPRR